MSGIAFAIPARDRIEARVVITSDECWEWQGWKNNRGYGMLRYEGHRYLAHRLAYEEWVAPIPDGLTIDHLCRNKGCVNPAHLEPVTMQENLMRSESVSAIAARKTECPQGHPYDGSNLYIDPHGGRKCRTCNTLRARALRSQHE